MLSSLAISSGYGMEKDTIRFFLGTDLIEKRGTQFFYLLIMTLRVLLERWSSASAPLNRSLERPIVSRWAAKLPSTSFPICKQIKNRISFFFKFDSNSHFFKNRKMNLLSFDSHSVCVLQSSGTPLQSFCVCDQLVFLNEGIQNKIRIFGKYSDLQVFEPCV